jgi:predicted ATPase
MVTHPKLVVLTGGPGAGKTALLEVVRRHFCEHVVVLPEAASIVFGGGLASRLTCGSQSHASDGA